MSNATSDAFDEEAFLQKLPYPVTPTNLKGAYAGVAPPDDFDPNTASPSELIKNGILWRRPTAADPPALREAWHRVFCAQVARQRSGHSRPGTTGRKDAHSKTAAQKNQRYKLYWHQLVGGSGDQRWALRRNHCPLESADRQ
jgi:hypothetical protein